MFKYFLGFIVLSFVVFESCFSGKSKYEAIRVRGSDSEVNLVQSIAENYMDNHDKVSVGVTGGGSGAGIAALINKKTDLANSSRSITEEELGFAINRGVNPFEIVFAMDALAIIVHENNTLDSIHLNELAAIYTGSTKTWGLGSVGNPPITLYGRQSSSGTYSFFREAILKAEYDQSMIGMSGTAQIVEAIRKDQHGIGYVSAGYLNEQVLRGLKVLHIVNPNNGFAYSPMDKEAITNGQYPITRPLLQYTDGAPSGVLLDFVKFQFSELGAKIIEENGFYPVKADSTILSL